MAEPASIGEEMTNETFAATHGVPVLRLRRVNAAKPRAGGEYVLYWMIAARRLTDNYALQYAAGEAERRGRPLVILEALRSDYRWASDRLHRFALDGMAEHARRLARSEVCYHAYVEPEKGAGRGLLEMLAGRACLVVTDEFPGFFLPRMVEAAAVRLDVPLIAVDSNGLLPLRVADKAYPTAYAFRRFLQGQLGEHLMDVPEEEPLRRHRLPRLEQLPAQLLERWPAMSATALEARDLTAQLPIDHAVPAVPYRGGTIAAESTLAVFLQDRLDSYAERRNEPEQEATSGLSPYLHWGHISVHRILRELARRERWSPSDLSSRTDGRREGWWGMGASAEAFLDQIVTWRELGYNMTSHRGDYDRYESLPPWARATLADHRADPRPAVYTLEQFEAAETHDELWNAAQRQLLREGRVHNYLRMLWGKKILEWTAAPEDALDVMIELNNRWGVDGRNPNSYSGIFWCLGRYDRPWPERAVFGKIRTMTSESTRRKYRVNGYLRRYSPGSV